MQRGLFASPSMRVWLKVDEVTLLPNLTLDTFHDTSEL